MVRAAAQALVRRRWEVVRFGIVGSTGFAINAAGLWLLYQTLGWPILPAQLVSAELALLNNFFWHHHWTYRGYGQMRLPRRLARFHLTAWTGLAIDVSVVTVGVSVFDLHYLVALVIAAATAMIWNLIVNLLFVWPGTPVGASPVSTYPARTADSGEHPVERRRRK